MSVPALPVPKLMEMDLDHEYPYDPDAPEDENHDNLLEARRMKDRRRYATMSPTQRAAYNAHRRDLYHKQGETARHRRRERERQRYHSLQGEEQKARNDRRAKLERDRYQKLSKEDLANRNSKRRDRSKSRKTNTKRAKSSHQPMPVVAAIGTEVPSLPEPSLNAIVGQVIGDAMDEGEVQV